MFTGWKRVPGGHNSYNSSQTFREFEMTYLCMTLHPSGPLAHTVIQVYWCKVVLWLHTVVTCGGMLLIIEAQGLLSS